MHCTSLRLSRNAGSLPCASAIHGSRLSLLPSVLFGFLPSGFNNRQMRQAVAQLLGNTDDGSRQATYDLRRLRGLIERIPSSHRHDLTQSGQRIALAYCRIDRRTLTLTLVPVPGRVQSYLEIIRFAASNRLCVDLEYQGSVRRIEPYSLRRTRDGNIVLHATRAVDGEHRSYRIDRIQDIRATRQSFIPRFAVALTPQGPPVIALTASRVESSGLPRRRARAVPRRTRSLAWPGGPR